MRHLLGWSLAVVVALTAFYVAWPAWSGHQIARAINAKDAPALAGKIDFDEVRARAKPVIEAEMERRLEQLKTNAGPLGAAIAGQLKKGLGGQLVDAAVANLLTPESIIQMVHQGRDFRKAWRRVASGGLQHPRGPGSSNGQQAESTPSQLPTSPVPRRLSLANVKSYRLTGPLSLAIGIAHNVDATEPDATVEMTFTGGNWKVTGLLPRL
ncbi:MAG: DUF2939 domain-containing protein [Hyphomicrobiaceae bacterium]